MSVTEDVVPPAPINNGEPGRGLERFTGVFQPPFAGGAQCVCVNIGRSYGGGRKRYLYRKVERN